jgi:hypothetical protein
VTRRCKRRTEAGLYAIVNYIQPFARLANYEGNGSANRTQIAPADIMRSPDCLQGLIKSKLRLLQSSADEAVRAVQESTNAIDRGRVMCRPPVKGGEL